MAMTECAQVLSRSQWKLIYEIINKLICCWETYRSVLGDTSLHQFTSEYKVWANMWKNETGKLPATAVQALDRCKEAALPNIYNLLQILAVLPVSTAEAERTFSIVTKTLTAVRSSMSEKRLEALVLMEAHRDEIPSTELILVVGC